MKAKENSKRNPHFQTPTTESDLRVGEIYPLWMHTVKSDSKPSTVAKYSGIYKNHLCTLADVPVTALNNTMLCAFTETLLTKSLSNRTVNDILTVLHLMLQYAAKEYALPVPEIKFLRTERTEIRVLSLGEQKRLRTYLLTDTDVHKFGTLLAMYTGMRIGELCALRWEDFDTDAIHIDKTMIRISAGDGKSELRVVPPKSESSVRYIPIPPALYEAVLQFKGEGYVLSDTRLSHTEPRLMQIKFEKYVKACELKNVTFHTLRHTFATRCIEAGVDAKTVSELLGHADTSITLNRYVHSSFELKQNSLEKMQKLLA